MKIESLSVRNFRNLSQLDLGFGFDNNIFLGRNGQGKTNCLEAIALSCSLRPIQSLQNVDLIKFNHECAKIKANFLGQQRLEIDVDITINGKRAKLNHQSLRSSLRLLNNIPLVTFIPADLNMVTGSAGLRRKAIDQATCSLFLDAAASLKAYEKILNHRNRLLKDWPIDSHVLATFTDMMIKEAAKVICYRLDGINRMQGFFDQNLKQILGPDFEGNILYVFGDTLLLEQSQSQVCRALEQEKERVSSLELKRKVSLFGPHLDDISLNLNGINSRRSASRGQSRALVLAFKLATMMAIQQVRNVSPIIILDDIVSELDESIKANLVEGISDLRSQAFFSVTDINTFGSILQKDQVLLVEGGMVK